MSGIGDFIGDLIKAAAKWVDKCLPEYEPSVWNSSTYVRQHNNCYNYGCDIQTNTYAQPGEAAGQKYTSIDCPAVTKAAKADGHQGITRLSEMAEKQVEYAIAIAEQKMAEKKIETLEKEEQKVLLDTRQKQIEKAKREAEAKARESEMKAREAEEGVLSVIPWFLCGMAAPPPRSSERA